MYILHHSLSRYPNGLNTARVTRTCSSDNCCSNTPHNGLPPVSNLHILPPPPTFAIQAVQYTKISRPCLCHNTRPMYKTFKDQTCLSVVMQLVRSIRPAAPLQLLPLCSTTATHNSILTPWCRVLLEKLTGLQLVKKFLAFHGTRRFITALTSVRHLSLS